jgi:hypothetical protein
MAKCMVRTAPQTSDPSSQVYTVEFADGIVGTVAQVEIQKRKPPFTRTLLKSWILLTTEQKTFGKDLSVRF